MNPLTTLASKFYAAVMARRNHRFDRGDRVVDVGRPVISVGNLTMGGTGKTPTVQWIVRLLQSRGHQPVVALRGYGAGRPQLSDEALEHEWMLPGVPVLADPDRVGAIEAFLDGDPSRDVVVLDDGFQHRFVQRQVNLVLVDARRDLDAERVFPAGRLREPLTSLRRATDVVVTHAPHVDEAIRGRVQTLHGRDPVAWCDHVWDGLIRFDADGESTLPSIDGMRVVTRLGIATAGGVRDQIAAAGAVITTDIAATDHARITTGQMRRLQEASRKADAVLVTAKDWVKMRPLVDWSMLQVPVLVPRLALEFVAGQEDLER
ncbi:MAG: tetraacyldisaccharide 4'-kinase, partial [Phycisphaerales bacterium]|nr:tetraacyldisaccharide 4'-kinase [Phycisphaerales bacterium]